MNSKNIVTGIIIFGAGLGLGYFICNKRLSKRYQEDVAEVKEFYMEKIREIYEFDDCELVFDHYPGLPGYIEIEAPSEEKLKELAVYFNLNFNEKFYNYSILYNNKIQN